MGGPYLRMIGSALNYMSLSTTTACATSYELMVLAWALDVFKVQAFSGVWAYGGISAPPKD